MKSTTTTTTRSSQEPGRRTRIPEKLEQQFDAFFMNVAQQCAQIIADDSSKNAIDVMHEAYFGFLRRKTDFFSEEERARESVCDAFDREREVQDSMKTTKEIDEAKALKKRERLERERKEKESNERKMIEQESKERKDRVREVLMKQKMEESLKKNKIVEIDDDGNEKKNNDGDDDDDDDGEVDEEKEREKKLLDECEQDDPHALQPGTVKPSVYNGGEAEHYVWSQTLQEVDVRLPVPIGSKAKDITCEFTATTFKFGLKSELPKLRIDNGKFCEAIKPDDSFWTLEDNREIRLTLTKFNQMNWWDCVIKGDPKIDTRKVQPENSNLSDLDGETRQTVEKMMYDQRQKAAGKPTSDQESKMDLMKNFMKQHPEMDFSNCKFDGDTLPSGFSM
jgi:hypothetical protein